MTAHGAETAGVNAFPIIALIGFLLGLVLELRLRGGFAVVYEATTSDGEKRAIKVLKQKNTELRGEIEESKQERAVERGRNQALREDLKRCAAQLRGKPEKPE